ncbi:MAG: zinc ribbon domain-containing protein [Myxococcota bacterium]
MSFPTPFKVCPSCREEFQRTVEFCSDCDVPLVFPGEEPAEEAASQEPLELLTKGGPWQLEALAEHLAQRGIPCHIDTDPPQAAIQGPQSYRRTGFQGRATELALYVATSDLGDARGLAEEHLRSRLPDGGEEIAEGEILDACPACETPLTPGADACGECGLPFAVQTIQCLSCGQEANSDEAACPHCGARWDA